VTRNGNTEMSISIDPVQTSNDPAGTEMLAAVQSRIAISGRRAEIESSLTTAAPIKSSHPTMTLSKATSVIEKLWLGKSITGIPEKQSVLPPRPLLELAEEGYNKLGEMIERMNTASY